ncbi:unnamed protein product [Linum tenue]|uniref:HAT C-terminal dimerisation domain-containing protein n=1 Tax=Linum tenue TaxID=586396 RepID=A0AAV0L6S2_9ROSI|nr:unnamed protein product [Linum tenue]
MITTELNHYLFKELIPHRSVDFDILMWWKLNGLKSPTLQAIARNCKKSLGHTSYISGL